MLEGKDCVPGHARAEGDAGVGAEPRQQWRPDPDSPFCSRGRQQGVGGTGAVYPASDLCPVLCAAGDAVCCPQVWRGMGGYIHQSVPGSFPLHTDWHAAVKLRCLVVLLCRGDPGAHAQCL